MIRRPWLYIYTVMRLPMKVRVFLLRREGHRLPLDEVRASAPHAGYLRVSREPGGRVGQWLRGAALYRQAEAVDPLLQLHRVELHSWDYRGVVLAGYESFWDRKRQTKYRQSRLVKFVDDAGDVRKDPASPRRTEAHEPA